MLSKPPSARDTLIEAMPVLMLRRSPGCYARLARLQNRKVQGDVANRGTLHSDGTVGVGAGAGVGVRNCEPLLDLPYAITPSYLPAIGVAAPPLGWR
jgi:hypothetical protein